MKIFKNITTYYTCFNFITYYTTMLKNQSEVVT